MSVTDPYPRRIVCLTEETTETLYLLGEQHRIVGISGYTVRPPEARQEKPKVSAFWNAKIDKILALEPDLVLGFSDMQAEIANQLVRAGLQVHVFNQRRIAGILQMMRMLGSMVGADAKAEALVQRLQAGLDEIAAAAAHLPRRPKVFFEEWNDPLISGIGWVSELVGVAGGDDIFPELAEKSHGKDRIVQDPLEVVRRAPDIVMGSWCGRKFKPEMVSARPGWAEVPAVRDGELHELKSSEILQPGPAALTDGVARLHALIGEWALRRA
ncbi:cobalamin-binding protein [Ideonella sp. BN130291]|uniref:cobalamin-binding protein n=1 Tax=Ideonella sp. BN130291 TaxID=3112940 RepID=UPI002E262B19|nr:cobalamin-binding protein [Ideonella sp. BN130291]